MDDREHYAITKCRECNGELYNAKCLPCSHTFCCSCLDALCRKTIPGGLQQCPQCKQSFRVPTHGCRDLPDNPLVLPLQTLREQVASARDTAQRLEQLNRVLEANNIEAGSKCVENVIRATETVSQLESRLETAERDRDEARQQLKEMMEQRESDSKQYCERCQQRDTLSTELKGSKDETTEGLLAKTSVTPALQGCDVASGNCITARVTSNKTVWAMLLVLLTAVVYGSMIAQRNLIKSKEEMATTASECSSRLHELAEQLQSERAERRRELAGLTQRLENERVVHKDELVELKQKLVRQLNTVTMSCDGRTLTGDGTWASVMSSLCRSSLVSSLLSNCCHPDVAASDDV